MTPSRIKRSVARWDQEKLTLPLSWVRSGEGAEGEAEEIEEGWGEIYRKEREIRKGGGSKE